jgi:hypothetical protein
MTVAVSVGMAMSVAVPMRVAVRVVVLIRVLVNMLGMVVIVVMSFPRCVGARVIEGALGIGVMRVRVVISWH